MIIPLIAGNLQLTLETDRRELENCIRNFSGFLLFLAAGVTASMLFISVMPSRPLRISVSLIAITFAASRTSLLKRRFQKIREICFRSGNRR